LKSGTPINKMEKYALFQTPIDLNWFNDVERTPERAQAGNWISVGMKGQLQVLKFPNGTSSASALYDMSSPLTYLQAVQVMKGLVGENYGKLVVGEDKVSAALEGLVKTNPDFNPETVTVQWYTAVRRYLMWRVPFAVQVRKINWGPDAYSGAAPETGVLVLNAGIEAYALQVETDLPGWFSLINGPEIRGADLYNEAELLPEEFLQQFVD
jgi:hypothetical protein